MTEGRSERATKNRTTARIGRFGWTSLWPRKTDHARHGERQASIFPCISTRLPSLSSKQASGGPPQFTLRRNLAYDSAGGDTRRPRSLDRRRKLPALAGRSPLSAASGPVSIRKQESECPRRPDEAFWRQTNKIGKAQS